MDTKIGLHADSCAQTSMDPPDDDNYITQTVTFSCGERTTEVYFGLYTAFKVNTEQVLAFPESNP